MRVVCVISWDMPGLSWGKLKKMKPKKLNLGCGKDIREGYVNIDRQHHDLNSFPYPFADEEFDEILCSHIIEHLDDMRGVMGELHRITRVGGTIRIKAPYFSSQAMFDCPDHRTFFTYNTFQHFQPLFYTAERRIFFCSARHWMKSERFRLFDAIINRFPRLYQRMFCWTFPASEIHYKLIRKPKK